MALGHGNKIVTKGLAFAFDRDNRAASWTGRKNLIKNTSGVIQWSLANLSGGGISRVTVISNEKYRITCTTSGSFRWYVPPANLRNGITYTLSMLFKYTNNGNTDFKFTDWCDIAPDKFTITPVGKGIYKLVLTGTRSVYDNTFRFADFMLDAGTEIEVWNVQLEEGDKATKYEPREIAAVGEQFRDWSGNVVPDSGTISYDDNGGARFDGASDHISLGVLESVQEGSRTNEAWVKAYQLSNWHGIFSCGTNFSNGFGLQMGPEQGIAAQGSGNYLRTSWTPVTHRWYHIIATHDHITNENRLYVDGKLENSATYNINYQVGVHQRIGVFYSAQNSLNFIGEMSQLRLYDRALTQSEVESNYIATAPRYRPGLTPDQPALSATHILEAWPEAPSGIYYMRLNTSGDVIPVYCDMTTDGGGWMLLVQNTNVNGGTKLNNGNYALESEDNPPIATSRANATYSYSILQYADQLKDSTAIFEYMIEGVERNRWGGIWRANDPSYTFNQTTNTATNITLTTQFDDWYYSNSSIEARMPYVTPTTNNGLLTTSVSVSSSWWGTLIQGNNSYSPAPYISAGGNSSTQNPGVIWYWMRA